jgi:ABC-type nitrate/sulfonate/bicarbonate transport system substrate-binding protein
MQAKEHSGTLRHDHKLRIGFVPLIDCGPFVAAYELGLFAKYGVKVKLQRELGWATVRDKVIFGELDASHAVVGMALAATVGSASTPCHCVSSLILSTNGNGITLSEELFSEGVRDAKTFKRFLESNGRRKPPTLGIVSPFASHNFLMRRWLRSGGVDPDKDVRIVIVPPPQVCQNLKTGNLDGFCVGEPWNSLAVHSRIGWTVATSTELAPDHPEKALIVRGDFALGRSEQHLAIMAALIEACAWCDVSENRETLVSLLARPEYLNLAPKVLQPSLTGRYDFGHGRHETIPDFINFSRGNANEPTDDKIQWVTSQIRDNGFCAFEKPSGALCRRVFRPDLYQKAVSLRSVTQSTDSLAIH